MKLRNYRMARKASAKSGSASGGKTTRSKTPAKGSSRTKKTERKKKDGSILLAEAVVKGISDKKGKRITWLDLRNIPGSVCEHFIICEGTSSTQIDALSRSVEEVVEKETGQKPWHSEGKQNAQWILIDYVSVVVHIFQSEAREFYNLEGLWADAKVVLEEN
jgi:ribosome-associated protein